MHQKENLYAAGLGALIGLSYTIGKATWGDGALADVTMIEVLASAIIGAVAGILAFTLRQRL